MGNRALDYLTTLFNLSLAKADLPAIWKRSLVLPVLKPGKPATEGPSYRPISLLCPASKLLERLLLPTLQQNFPLNETQHGFRSDRSTTTALLPIVSDIAAGFNQRKPPMWTVLVSLDLSRAFDTVNHDKLLQKINATSIHNNVKRWLSAYLKGREQAVNYGGVQSVFKGVHRGVPQGAVSSPTLFNLYVSDFPALRSKHQTFADDMNLYASAVDITEAETALSLDLADVSHWAEEVELDISPSKSTVTLFSPSTHEFSYHPQVSLGDTFLPLEKNPKVLGVTLDPLFTFSPHVRVVAKKARERLRILKALAGTTWGQDKETLLISYKALIHSTTYTNKPVPEIITSTKLRAKTLILARNGMLECGKNFKGTLPELCQNCLVTDNEDHRMNTCPKWKDTNFLDSETKIEFGNIYSNDPAVLPTIIERIQKVWELSLGKGLMKRTS